MYHFHEFPYNRTRTILKKGMRGNGTMQIGYMRISKGEQTTTLQEDALAKATVERTYRDVMSGVTDHRHQFQVMHDSARAGATIVGWRRDRLGRSLKHLIDRVMGLQARGNSFRSQ